MRVARLIPAVLLIAGGISAGCSPGTTDPTEAIAGAYHLSSINGMSLPYVWVFQDPDNQISFASGTLTLHADRTFVDETTFSLLIDGEAQSQQLVAGGNWALAGNTLNLTPTDGAPPYSMEWNGKDRLTQTFDQLVLLYLK
jgi:hypothetical protein